VGDLDADGWQEYRSQQRAIGASEVAAVLGLSPYAGPFTVCMARRGVPVEVDEVAVAKGRLAEPLLIAANQDDEDDIPSLWRAPYTLAHPDTDALVCHLDALADDGGPFECKWTGMHDTRDVLADFERYGEIEAVAGTSVLCWWLQLQAQMAILGADRGTLAVLVGDRALLHALNGLPVPERDRWVLTIEADLDWQAVIVREVDAFYERYVLGDETPEPMHRDLAAVRKAWRVERGLEVTDESVAQHVLAYQDAHAAMKAAEDEKKTAEVAIRAALGTAERLYFGCAKPVKITSNGRLYVPRRTG
jgi:hypothetical protein